MKLTKKYFQNGLSLIELMIVVTIVGSLTAIVIPTYSAYIIKSERKRALTELYQLHFFIEGYYTLNNATYPDDLSECVLCDLSTHYLFSLNKNGTGNNSFVLSATPKTAQQQKDTDCYTLKLNAAFETSNQDKDGNVINNEKCWF